MVVLHISQKYVSIWELAASKNAANLCPKYRMTQKQIGRFNDQTSVFGGPLNNLSHDDPQ